MGLKMVIDLREDGLLFEALISSGICEDYTATGTRFVVNRNMVGRRLISSLWFTSLSRENI